MSEQVRITKRNYYIGNATLLDANCAIFAKKGADDDRRIPFSLPGFLIFDY